MDPSLLHIEGEAPEVPGFLSHSAGGLQHDVLQDDVVEELETGDTVAFTGSVHTVYYTEDTGSGYTV